MDMKMGVLDWIALAVLTAILFTTIFRFLIKELLGLTSTTLPVQVKCEKLIGEEAMRAGVNDGWVLRNNLLNNYLVNQKKLEQASFLVRDITTQDTIDSAGPPIPHDLFCMRIAFWTLTIRKKMH